MKIYSWYFWSWSLLNHISIQNRLSLKRGTRNGERGMRLTIFHEILHSEQFEGTEFIDDDSFVSFLRPANGGRCHLSGHSFRWRAANASILMKFCTLHKCRAVNSMVAKFLTPVNIEICQCRHLSSVRPWFWKFWMKNSKCINFDETSYSTQVEGGEFNSNNNILWFSTPVKFDTCGQNLTNLTIGTWWSFFSQFWTKNGKSPNFDKILYFAQIERNEFISDNSFLGFLTPANIGNCPYWYLLSFRLRFSTKNGKCFSFDKSLYFAQNEGGEFNGVDIERCKWVPQKNKT